MAVTAAKKNLLYEYSVYIPTHSEWTVLSILLIVMDIVDHFLCYKGQLPVIHYMCCNTVWHMQL